MDLILTTPQVTNGEVPEFYWFLFARWSSYNGGNDWDIDADGDSLINGLDVIRMPMVFQIGGTKMKATTGLWMLMILNLEAHLI